MHLIREKEKMARYLAKWKTDPSKEFHFFIFATLLGFKAKGMGGGGLDLKPQKFEHIFVAVITNFFPLSSVQILLIPACCLLCVLYNYM